MTATPPSNLKLIVKDLGRMPYAEAFDLQKRLQQEVIEARDPARGYAPIAYLLLVEHDPPVITMSRRADTTHNLLASSQQLQSAGIQLEKTDRGGDITYHGPGQLVCYPIMDLNALGLNIRRYVHFLEQIIIDTLAHFDVTGQRDPDAIGVWVDDVCGGGKICAIGIRVSRWVSMHGFAFNITTNLDHFQHIVPCGLTGREVTSMQKILGDDRCPDMQTVKDVVAQKFQSAIQAGLERAEGERRPG